VEADNEGHGRDGGRRGGVGAAVDYGFRLLAGLATHQRAHQPQDELLERLPEKPVGDVSELFFTWSGAASSPTSRPSAANWWRRSQSSRGVGTPAATPMIAVEG
jgi:hypothetical protein